MHKIYYLKTCNTCTRFLKNLKNPEKFKLQDIKENPLTVSQLEALRTLSGSYESLFSRRAKLYSEMGLNQQKLSEDDYKHYILHHYTFLKRPVTVLGEQLFTGADAKTLEAVNQIVSS